MKKPQGKNIMSASGTPGGHKNISASRLAEFASSRTVKIPRQGPSLPLLSEVAYIRKNDCKTTTPRSEAVQWKSIMALNE